MYFFAEGGGKKSSIVVVVEVFGLLEVEETWPLRRLPVPLLFEYDIVCRNDEHKEAKGSKTGEI